VIEFSWEEMKSLFGDHAPEKDGHACSIYNQGGNFQKVRKMFESTTNIQKMLVEYNKSKFSLELQLHCSPGSSSSQEDKEEEIE
jgi:hypothetical protein